MKQPMTAKEWSELKEINITNRDAYLMNIDVKYHLEKFAEEINNEFNKSGTISSILTDYLTKNNIV